MPSYGTDLDNQPLRYYKGNAVYLTMYLALALTAGVVLTLLLNAARIMPWFLAFIPQAFASGAIWQPFTYVFVDQISFFTPLGLLVFYFWGVEVEKYLGRRHFLAICGALVALPPVLSFFFYIAGLGGGMLTGNFYLVSGLLIAFATLYPDLDYIGGWIPLKWFAFACIACGAIMFFPERNWAGLFILLANCAAAFAMVRHARGLFDFNFKFSWPRKKPKFRVLSKPAEARPVRTAAPPVSDDETEIDALLDKIASSGLKSLSEAEKTRLETLRQRMLRKGS